MYFKKKEIYKKHKKIMQFILSLGTFLLFFYQIFSTIACE